VGFPLLAARPATAPLSSSWHERDPSQARPGRQEGQESLLSSSELAVAPPPGLDWESADIGPRVLDNSAAGKAQLLLCSLAELFLRGDLLWWSVLGSALTQQRHQQLQSQEGLALLVSYLATSQACTLDETVTLIFCCTSGETQRGGGGEPCPTTPARRRGWRRQAPQEVLRFQRQLPGNSIHSSAILR
jgi:hypothetical protein